MKSKDNSRGWRLDFSNSNQTHINWWLKPDLSKPKIEYHGMIRIGNAGENEYNMILQHFPWKNKPI